jgi:hypothetical protein
VPDLPRAPPRRRKKKTDSDDDEFVPDDASEDASSDSPLSSDAEAYGPVPFDPVDTDNDFDVRCFASSPHVSPDGRSPSHV